MGVTGDGCIVRDLETLNERDARIPVFCSARHKTCIPAKLAFRLPAEGRSPSPPRAKRAVTTISTEAHQLSTDLWRTETDEHCIEH